MIILITILSIFKKFNSSNLMGINFYQVTGLKQSSTQKEVKKNYKKFLSQKKIQKTPSLQTINLWNQIETAYSIIGSEHSRALYDLCGLDFLNVTTFQVLGYHSDEALEAIKKMMGRVPPEMANFGGMIYYPIQFELIDFLRGSTKEIVSIHLVECQCPNGGIKCTKCKNTPYMEEYITETLDLPPGAFEFYRIIGRGLGDTPKGRGASDVIFVAQSKPHSKFIREGKNLKTIINLTLKDIIKEENIIIEGIDEEKISIPIKGLNYNEEFHIEGKGLPDFFIPSQRGDIIVNFNINLPINLLKNNLNEILNILSNNENDYY